MKFEKLNAGIKKRQEEEIVKKMASLPIFFDPFCGA
jgi:hypothetical protein